MEQFLQINDEKMDRIIYYETIEDRLVDLYRVFKELLIRLRNTKQNPLSFLLVTHIEKQWKERLVESGDNIPIKNEID